jgi:hypothetical protein
MKFVLLIDEGSLRRVRNAIDRVDEVSRKNEVVRGAHGTNRSSLDEAALQLIASLRASFRILARTRRQ